MSLVFLLAFQHIKEVGTDSYREYVQRLTPMEKVKSFINKK